MLFMRDFLTKPECFVDRSQENDFVSKNLFETFKDQVNIPKIQFDKEVNVASL